ncbi:MAG: outer membrane beta-barrel protein [Bacteroidota bacterium]
MKKHVFLIFFLMPMMLVSLTGFAQLFKGEIIGGSNKSQVDGDEAYGFKKYGLVGGVGVVAPFYGNWSFSLETLYSQRGSKLKPQYNDSLDGSYRLKLDYAEVPFMIQYTDHDVVSAGLGVSWSRLVNVDEFKNGFRVDSVTLLSKVFDRNDWMAFGDLRVRVYKNLILNARYSYSLQKIATRTVNDSETGKPNVRDFYNNLWSFRLIYMINEKRPDKTGQKKDPGNE